MPGEYRGDFTRDSFDPLRHYSRVLMQQGRVQLDADWNEQTSILLHALRSLAADLIGRHGGSGPGAFAISPPATGDWSAFSIGAGHYYVDGIRCENEQLIENAAQSGFPFPDSAIDGKKHLVYLDVWERHVTCVEDDSIREVALGGPDTATRGQVVFQVKSFNLELTLPPSDRQKALLALNNAVDSLVTAIAANDAKAIGTSRDTIDGLVFDGSLFLSTTGRMAARARQSGNADEPCSSSLEPKFNGPENQLYRVEIQRSGNAWDGLKKGGNAASAATFKWSRDNGSVVFPILRLSDDQVTLTHLGRDSRHTLAPGDWVEIVDDDTALRCQPGRLLQVKTVNQDDMSITVDSADGNPSAGGETKHPLLRRWDHRGDSVDLSNGALLVSEGDDQWITLEDGVRIQFRPPEAAQPNQYRAGDYWLIPARTATSDVIWPKDSAGNPAALPPHGIEHQFAPLAHVDSSAANPVFTDLRRIVQQLSQAVAS
jgi:hypothetical protein